MYQDNDGSESDSGTPENLYRLRPKQLGRGLPEMQGMRVLYDRQSGDSLDEMPHRQVGARQGRGDPFRDS